MDEEDNLKVFSDQKISLLPPLKTAKFYHASNFNKTEP
jgi:hypothetical protein